jgi:hypothetical protein
MIVLCAEYELGAFWRLVALEAIGSVIRVVRVIAEEAGGEEGSGSDESYRSKGRCVRGYVRG